MIIDLYNDDPPTEGLVFLDFLDPANDKFRRWNHIEVLRKTGPHTFSMITKEGALLNLVFDDCSVTHFDRTTETRITSLDELVMVWSAMQVGESM